MTKKSDTQKAIPVLIPSPDLRAPTSSIVNLFEVSMKVNMPFLFNTISKYGTPLARQILLDSTVKMMKDNKLLDEKADKVYVIWLDSDILIPDTEVDHIAECVKKRENCVWDYRLLDRQTIDEERGIYGLGLATLWMPIDYKFKSGYINGELVSEDVKLFEELKIKPKIMGKVNHLKMVIL